MPTAIAEWCASCLQDDTRVSAMHVIAKVPLCSGCFFTLKDEPNMLRDLREAVVNPLENPFLRAHDIPKQDAKVVLCSCGKPARHAGRCFGVKVVKEGNLRVTTRAETNPPEPKYAEPLEGYSEIGGLRVRLMKTADYISKFGSFRSKGMTAQTQEMWEAITNLNMGDCIVVAVPDGKDPFKMRSSLCNTLQRLCRANKPPFRIRMGANTLKRHVVIAKEELEEK